MFRVWVYGYTMWSTNHIMIATFRQVRTDALLPPSPNNTFQALHEWMMFELFVVDAIVDICDVCHVCSLWCSKE